MDLRTVIVLFFLLYLVSSKKTLREKPRARHNRNKDSGFCELEINCKSDEMEIPGAAQVRLPIRGPRGPVGVPGQKGDTGENGLPGMPGLAGLSAPVPRKIAFFVGLSENVGPVTESIDVVFDKIVTNIGSGYDPLTGRFTAPVNGTYQFNVIVSAQGRQKAAVMLLKNGGQIATVWAESIPYWASASNIVILSLDQGEQAYNLLAIPSTYAMQYAFVLISCCLPVIFVSLFYFAYLSYQ